RRAPSERRARSSGSASRTSAAASPETVGRIPPEGSTATPQEASTRRPGPLALRQTTGSPAPSASRIAMPPDSRKVGETEGDRQGLEPRRLGPVADHLEAAGEASPARRRRRGERKAESLGRAEPAGTEDAQRRPPGRRARGRV